MAPGEHQQLLVSLSEVTDYVGTTHGTPIDADLAASVDALDRIRSLVQSLGGGLGRKTSTEHGEQEGAITRQEIAKTLAAFEDGVVGRAFVAQAWPLAAPWLGNKESRAFRIKYGEVVLHLRTAEDVGRALELMRDAVAAPRRKARAVRKGRKAKAKATRKPTGARKAKKVTKARKGAKSAPKKAAKRKKPKRRKR